MQLLACIALRTRLRPHIAVFTSSLLLLTATTITEARNVHRTVSTLAAADSGRFHILTAVTDSFPRVSLIVRAERSTGEPLRNISAGQIKIIEDGLVCQSPSVTRATQLMSLDVAMVLACSSLHSHSIVPTRSTRQQVYTNDVVKGAYNALMLFTDSLVQSDRIALIALTKKDILATQLTNNHDSIVSVTSRLQVHGNDAFNDAVHRAIDVVSNGRGIRVVVALTDRNDNRSKTSQDAIISMAKQHGIALFVVGLGAVDIQPLQHLALHSNGQFFYARDENDLGVVFNSIRQRMHAYYAVTYETVNYEPNSIGRSVRLLYESDSIHVPPAGASFLLHFSAIEYLKLRRTYMLLLSAIVAIAALATCVVFYRRWSRRQSETNNQHNPL
jgi:hypothetical protein